MRLMLSIAFHFFDNSGWLESVSRILIFLWLSSSCHFELVAFQSITIHNVQYLIEHSKVLSTCLIMTMNNISSENGTKERLGYANHFKW